MNGSRLAGVLFVAAMLVTGSVWGAEKGDKVVGSADLAAVSGNSATLVQTEAPLPVAVDVAAAAKDPASDSEVAPKAGTAAKTEATPHAEATPDVKVAPDAETAPKEEAAPQSETASDQEGTEETVKEVHIADPIEPWNRLMFKFNDKLYYWVLRPVARGYSAITPEPVRISIGNFFRNVQMPVRFVNCLLQGKIKGAGTELARFGVNTTVGLAGFFDVARDKLDLFAQNEDFGQTLGFYGLPGMMYIVWPFLGPSTVRDTVGFVGDSFADPVNYIEPFYVPLSLHVFERVNKTSLDINGYDDFKKSTVEPYTSMKNAYVQHRDAQIKE